MSEQLRNTNIEWAPALKDIAREMGILALLMARAGGVTVETKPDGSKVTGIDKELNYLLKVRSEKAFPDVAVWSEEGSTALYGDLEGIRDRSLVLGDPIDGTDKLVKALEAGIMEECRSTVMLAAFAPNQIIPEAAVVYAPFLPEQPMLWADASGAYIEEKTGGSRQLRLTGEGPTELEDVATYKISRWNGCVPDLKNMAEMLPNARDERDELRLTSVAEGRVDLSIFPGAFSNLHDIIPPLFVARQAGAATMALDGRPFEELMNGRVPGVLVAANQQLAERAISYFGITKD